MTQGRSSLWVHWVLFIGVLVPACPLILSESSADLGILPGVVLVYLSSWVVVQWATWRRPLFGLLSKALSRRQRLDLHRALAQTATTSILLPLAALGVAWFRGQG